jgi:hypothetical protein
VFTIKGERKKHKMCNAKKKKCKLSAAKMRVLRLTEIHKKKQIRNTINIEKIGAASILWG